MVDRLLRQPKERLLSPLALRLGTTIHPTAITLVAFGCGLGAAAAAWRQAYGLALGLWVLNRVIDGLDGTVARHANTQSDWGGYLDILLDTVIYALVPVGLALGNSSTAGLISLVVMLSSFYINSISWSYLAAILEKRQAGAKAGGEMTSVTMPVGLVEGTETVIIFCVFLLLPHLYPILFAAMTVLVLLTILQRLVWAMHTLREERP